MDQGAQPRVPVPAQPGMAVVARAQRQVQPGGQGGRRMRRPQPVRDQGLLPVREPPRVGGRVFSYQVHRLAQHVVLQPLPADDRLERLRVVRQERIVQVHATASLPRAGRDRPLLVFHDPPAHGADSRPALARRGTQAHAPTIRQHRAGPHPLGQTRPAAPMRPEARVRAHPRRKSAPGRPAQTPHHLPRVHPAREILLRRARPLLDAEPATTHQRPDLPPTQPPTFRPHPRRIPYKMRRKPPPH
jgi:hypothetical protein